MMIILRVRLPNLKGIQKLKKVIKLWDCKSIWIEIINPLSSSQKGVIGNNSIYFLMFTKFINNNLINVITKIFIYIINYSLVYNIVWV